MDRREFLRTSGAAGFAVVWGGAACASAIGTQGASTSAASVGSLFPLDHVGLQLYTVRTLVQQQGVEQTLAQVAAAGYKIVETAGLYNLQPAALRALFDRNGLRATSGHYPLDQVESGDAFTTARALGQEWVVVPSIPQSIHGSLAAFAALGDRFNRIGEKARAAGLGFAYHNHNFEFETFGGTTPAYDTLLARTDPALVSFELDAYWAYKAGYDPVQYFERYPGRFKLCHLKDSTPAPEKAFADVGSGVIDYRKLFAASRVAGLQYAFVEHDQPKDALASIRASHDYLARLLQPA
jgi:sugar phosphate isomerase/epimerase